MSEEKILENVPFVKENSLISVSFTNRNIPVVSSVDVARHFGKKHKHVLRDIDKIIANLPESFNGPNFGPVEYYDNKGEKRRVFYLTRDAFSLLAMGFTGKEALIWKIRYIQAFNEMESVLRNKVISLESHEKICKAIYDLGPDKKRKLRSVVRYHKIGLGKGGIAKLVGIHGRQVSKLLQCAKSLGFLKEKSVQNSLLEA